MAHIGIYGFKYNSPYNISEAISKMEVLVAR